MSDSEEARRVPMLQVAIALGAVYLIWGSTYLAIRFAIETIPPFLMAAARYLTAGVLLYGWSRLRGAPRPSLVHWRSAVIIGALLLLAGNGGVVWAEQRVSSGLVALLISTEPLWIVLMVWLRDRRQRPGGRVIAGLLLGFVGLMLLVRPGSSGGGLDPLGVVAVLVASLCWAWGSLYGQRAKLPDSPLLATAMQMLGGGALLLLAAALTGEPARFAPRRGLDAVAALRSAYLIVFGAIIAFTAYVWLLRVGAAGAGLDLRLREPGGRRPPRLGLRRRAAHPGDPDRRGGDPDRRGPDLQRAGEERGGGGGCGGGCRGRGSGGLRGAVRGSNTDEQGRKGQTGTAEQTGFFPGVPVRPCLSLFVRVFAFPTAASPPPSPDPAAAAPPPRRRTCGRRRRRSRRSG